MMENPKYEKVIFINENYFYEEENIVEAISLLIYCMFETNKKFDEKSYRFCIETAPTHVAGVIGIRIQWGRTAS